MYSSRRRCCKVLAKLGSRTLLEDIVTMPDEVRYMVRFMPVTFGGLDMYVAIETQFKLGAARVG